MVKSKVIADFRGRVVGAYPRGRLFKNFVPRMGAYSRGALIRGGRLFEGALNRSITVLVPTYADVPTFFKRLRSEYQLCERSKYYLCALLPLLLQLHHLQTNSKVSSRYIYLPALEFSEPQVMRDFNIYYLHSKLSSL